MDKLKIRNKCKFYHYFVLLIVILCWNNIASASPLSLQYSVTDLGNSLYDYQFTLTLDNHNNSWNSGEGWSGITFGDSENSSSSSPLTNFQGDLGDLPIGPFQSFTQVLGVHNGPALHIVDSNNQIVYWTPLSIGESISWSGTSTANLQQGDLHFSTLLCQNCGIEWGGPDYAMFEVASRVETASISSVPEPSTLLLSLSGLSGIIALRRKLWLKRI